MFLQKKENNRQKSEKMTQNPMKRQKVQNKL